MTHTERIDHCKKAAQNYSKEEFDLYIAEMGWEDWMGELCEEGYEDRDLYGSELYEIYLVQKEAFLKEYPDAKITTKILADFN